jgi:hypothetical protein
MFCLVTAAVYSPPGSPLKKLSGCSPPTVLTIVASTSAVAAMFSRAFSSVVCFAARAVCASASLAMPSSPMLPSVAAVPATRRRRVAAGWSACTRSIDW